MKGAVAALGVVCLVLLAALIGVMGELPNPSDRTVSVAALPDGCTLLLHRVRHEIHPASECRNVGRALLNVAPP